MSHKKLIDTVVSGKSATHMLDSLMEELPSLPALYTSIRKELPSDAVVRIEDDTVFIKCKDNNTVTEEVYYLTLVYPELDFVME